MNLESVEPAIRVHTSFATVHTGHEDDDEDDDNNKVDSDDHHHDHDQEDKDNIG